MKFFQLKFSSHATIYLIVLALLVIVFYVFLPFVGICLLFLLIFVAYFFRDPDKIIPQDENLILSPADGIITFIGNCKPPLSLLDDCNFTKISIFLNIFNVHVNRMPIMGVIKKIKYIHGKFINASFDKTSEDNERSYYKIKSSLGEDIIVVQIAGLIARRIVTETLQDQDLQQGSRIGMIRFGSRADLYFANYVPLVKVNQKAIAGETLLAKK